MAEIRKLTQEELEGISGGAVREVHNDSVPYAYIRVAPGLSSEILFSVDNGTKLSTTGNKITRDGYTWYEVYLAGRYSYGWIAGSLIGF